MAVLIAIGLYYDKNHDFAYSRALRGLIGDCIMMIRRKRSYSNELSQKIEVEENPTARNSMFDHEKAYVDAAPPTSPHKKPVEVLTE